MSKKMKLEQQQRGRTFRKRWTFSAILAASVATSACVTTADESESVEAANDELYVASTKIWSNPVIPVCWEQAGFATEKAWIRSALSQAWEAESAVAFTGFGQCVAGATGLRVRLADSQGFTVALGSALNGVVNGVNLNTWVSSSCVGGWSRERCVKSTAVHEFGHALGFSHEQIRPDTPASCTEPDGGESGDTTVGAWDLGSVMNYCNPVRNGDARLSGTDIEGVQRFYGANRPISVVSKASNRIDAFVRGTDNSLQTRSWNGTAWSAWTSLGGIITSPPAAASWDSNRIDVFARASDGSLVTKFYNGVSWSGWFNLGGTILGAPVAVARAANRLDVFARGTDGALKTRAFDGTSWGAWTSLGGDFVGTPAVTSWSSSRIDVFVRNTDNTLRTIAWTGSWSAWLNLGGDIRSSPAAASWGLNRIDVFAAANDGSLVTKSWTGAAWSAFVNMGGVLLWSPEVVSHDVNRLHVLVAGTDGTVFNRIWDGASWSPFSSLGGSERGSPAAVSWGVNRVDAFVRTNTNALSSVAWSSGGGWSGWLSLGGIVL
jgi:hypothetical protein